MGNHTEMGSGQSNKGTLRLAYKVKTVNYAILCPAYIASSRVVISIRPIWYNDACSNPFTILSEQEKWVQMKGEGMKREKEKEEKETKRKKENHFEGWFLTTGFTIY